MHRMLLIGNIGGRRVGLRTWFGSVARRRLYGDAWPILLAGRGADWGSTNDSRDPVLGVAARCGGVGRRIRGRRRRRSNLRRVIDEASAFVTQLHIPGLYRLESPDQLGVATLACERPQRRTRPSRNDTGPR